MTTRRYVRWISIVAALAFWVALAVMDVGTIPEPHTEPYTWWLPVQVLVVFVPVIGIGYFAGRADVEDAPSPGYDSEEERDGCTNSR